MLNEIALYHSPTSLPVTRTATEAKQSISVRYVQKKKSGTQGYTKVKK